MLQACRLRMSYPLAMMEVWKRTRQWHRRRRPLWLLSLRLLLCSRAVTLLFPVALFPVPLADLTLRLSLMIRCSGFLMGLWMFLPAWRGRKRNWRL